MHLIRGYEARETRGHPSGKHRGKAKPRQNSMHKQGPRIQAFIEFAQRNLDISGRFGERTSLNNVASRDYREHLDSSRAISTLGNPTAVRRYADALSRFEHLI